MDETHSNSSPLDMAAGEMQTWTIEIIDEISSRMWILQIMFESGNRK